MLQPLPTAPTPSKVLTRIRSLARSPPTPPSSRARPSRSPRPTRESPLPPFQSTYPNAPCSITVTNTDIHTVTDIIPVTITENVPVTVKVPVTEQKTVTGYSTVVVSAHQTVYQSSPLKEPTTVILPTKVTVTGKPGPGPSNTTTPAPPVSTAGADRREVVGPAMALFAGMVGAVVLL